MRKQQIFPNHQRWYAKWKLSWNIYTMHTCFCTFDANWYAQLVLINKISASELSRKFIKECVVGWVLFLYRENRALFWENLWFYWEVFGMSTAGYLLLVSFLPFLCERLGMRGCSCFPFPSFSFASDTLFAHLLIFLPPPPSHVCTGCLSGTGYLSSF